ncbi:MAG TPA: putative DNA modification/repair radical SAM protein [Prolixibacteraceae bacterium]|nr:putative DNA modification/repair radical SAM protein [Prolixibacteraceae bacterium]
MNEVIDKKLKILADAAKYDVSCASSGNTRRNSSKGIGNAVGCGICHSFTEDGRCISLLKVLMTNHCIYDCAYCINRRSNDRPRAAFTPRELADLTIGFYRRNYIEGLFLSSGVLKNPDYTMERMTEVAKILRIQERYNGYIHMKAIPGSSPELIRKAGLYADRLSVNMEIPTNPELKRLAPEKDHAEIYRPMGLIHSGILESKAERQRYRKAPAFAPAGQSTQLIVGATPESDQQILSLATSLYREQGLKRVYYSGYLPVNEYDQRLPALKTPPLVRENRLYQSDWLMRFYKFSANEIVSDMHPFLDLDVDPKLAYALRNFHLYPINVNTADYEMILRVPGIGVQSAQRIVQARKFRKLTSEHLRKIGVVMKRAQYFITNNELPASIHELQPEFLKKQLLSAEARKRNPAPVDQLKLFDFSRPVLADSFLRERFLSH